MCQSAKVELLSHKVGIRSTLVGKVGKVVPPICLGYVTRLSVDAWHHGSYQTIYI